MFFFVFLKCKTGKLIAANHSLFVRIKLASERRTVSSISPGQFGYVVRLAPGGLHEAEELEGRDHASKASLVHRVHVVHVVLLVPIVLGRRRPHDGKPRLKRR